MYAGQLSTIVCNECVLHWYFITTCVTVCKGMEVHWQPALVLNLGSYPTRVIHSVIHKYRGNGV